MRTVSCGTEPRCRAGAPSGVGHVGVAAPLAPEGAFRAVARNEHRVIAHGPQTLGDAGNQRGLVALRKIGPANGTGKQHVADKGALGLGGIKHHVARRVARAVAHGQFTLPYPHRVSILQPPRGLECLRGRKAKHLALLRQAVNPELVARVRTDDGQLQPLGQLACATGMVNMRMGQQNLRELQAQALDLGQHPVQVTAGIDDCSLLGLVAPDQ